MHKRTIAALAMAISFGAQAEWTAVVESATNDHMFYLDYATLKKTQYGYRVWQLQDLANKWPDGTKSIKALWEVDCKEERSRFLQYTYFSGQMGVGGVTGGRSAPGGWEYVMPGSIAETLLKEVCRAGK